MIFNDKIDINKSFFDYILFYWNLMIKELKENKNNIDIRIYIQQIIPQFIQCIQEYEDFSTPIKRTEFENKINDIVINSIKDYPRYYNKYQYENSLLNSFTQFEKMIKEYPNIINDQQKFPYYKYYSNL